MLDKVNNLYDLTLFLIGMCVVVFIGTVGYLIGIVKYAKMHMQLTKELGNMKINIMKDKDNI